LQAEAAEPVECSWCDSAHDLTGSPADYDPLLASIGDARVVALGESTHGTHEFYRERAKITERLIRERGFRALIIEADWPDTDRMNRYVRGLGEDHSAEQALAAYRDFPQWMWRKAEFRALVERLRAYNEGAPAAEKVGVYGMDVYNLYGAADAVLSFLEERDPQAADRAARDYRCFARYRPDAQAYGQETKRPPRSCETQAAAVLELVRQMPRGSDPLAREDHFSALRSANSVVGAEEYFRTAYGGGNSWNARDRRMVATIAEIARHVDEEGDGKVVVWAHNSHVGDARATDARLRGEVNVGQVLRESWGADAYLVGLFTHSGTVYAADAWDEPGRRRQLRPALPDSFEGQFHAGGLENALILLDRDASAAHAERLQRAVGVIYRPQTERQSHYLQARLGEQFDAVLFFDETRSIDPP
jgi:erythromycin esterase-like protein